ncbi:MAG: DUF2828 family protein [Oscillospiraceae bacterium]|nr:DUF2828 family protein [Oscillospiraceae bacterium]
MSYLENLKEQADYTRTLNGALTHGSTGDACLDLFAVAGGMRYRNPADVIRMFELAYIENRDLAMKLLFHIRDIREGMGERKMFRTLLRHVAFKWPESARKNVALVAEYGRWDDLLCLYKTPAQKQMVEVIRTQLEKDLAAADRREAGDVDAPISLLAKWLPSPNASSHKTQKLGKWMAMQLGMEEREYRKMLSRLRAHSCVTERYLTRKSLHKIDYEAVPAGAMLKYRSAFDRNDPESFMEYLMDVSDGTKKMHADTLFPYELIRPFFEHHNSGWCKSFRFAPKHAAGKEVLEVLWNSQCQKIAQDNAIAVVDVSGSMFWGQSKQALPILMAVALGLYCAERCQGVFHNHMITFSERPQLVEIHGRNLEEKLNYMLRTNWGMSTNMEAVFDLLLDTAIRTNARQEEMPAAIYIFSDMEFNCAVRDPNKTVYDNARERFAKHGYQLPAVIFQNVNSWQMNAPVRGNTRGAALCSGAGTASFKHKFDGNVTPMSHMLRVLMSDRYKEVHA